MDAAGHGGAAPGDEIALKVQAALVRVEFGGHGVVAHRQDRGREPPGLGEGCGDRGQGLAGVQAQGAQDVQGQVAVAQLEPVFAAEAP